ncbi:hypothetical protein LOY38_19680 [Pseudomonas sp. B21-015]|uniref:hypothetical protein n=1 Tax=Pseudomonas sp. B21-015 TaxID=2895473 RepID=UPI00215DDFA8|nr:hypothetical protein [Pseudomonas sp. B21-015]UVM48591.1 hypothetical protein LOY38_19680 [Pseudomonas sp. B21-015]
MPDRSDSYRGFIQRYPRTDFRQQLHESDRTSEIGLGKVHDIVEAMFVGIYNEDGSIVAEQHFDEQTLRQNLGVIRVLPEAALEIGLQNTVRFAGPVKSDF